MLILQKAELIDRSLHFDVDLRKLDMDRSVRKKFHSYKRNGAQSAELLTYKRIDRRTE